jgi:hypothetical protein
MIAIPLSYPSNRAREVIRPDSSQLCFFVLPSSWLPFGKPRRTFASSPGNEARHSLSVDVNGFGN